MEPSEEPITTPQEGQPKESLVDDTEFDSAEGERAASTPLVLTFIRKILYLTNIIRVTMFLH